ncbi:MAG: hypothetical protein K5668_04485 [Lachnospiraceae bacterium]|nr:hypothetical protein [Lachnospiraceae bacterium]
MLKPERLRATYSIEISRDLYEEIRINETWDMDGKAARSGRYGEGYLWTELYGQSNSEPFDKWAFNYEMSFQGGYGSPESFFENHFSQEKVRRRGLSFLYPPENYPGSQEDYVKSDPRISWLYNKRSFDAVFPVLCEHGKTHLVMELEGRLDDGRLITLSYSTDDGGEIILEGKHLLNICFSDERYSTRNFPRPLEIGRPEGSENGKRAATLYGVYSFSELLKGLEMTAKKALFYEKYSATGKKTIYRISTLFGKDLIADRTDLSEEDLIRKGAEKLAEPEIGGRKIGLFYWNYDTSVKSLGGYCEQAFYPDTYRIKKNASDGGNVSAGQEYEYYMVFDELTDLTGWYPLDRFIWEGDPEPIDVSDLRKIILDIFTGGNENRKDYESFSPEKIQ